MYLQDLYIENNGPLRSVNLKLPFTGDGLPKPTVIVGGNGSGKTNLLSTVADALVECATTHYRDVVPFGPGADRPWFRIAGASTISIGAAASISLLRFEHDSISYFFLEKAGKVDPNEAQNRVPETFKPIVTWPEEGNIKDFQIVDEKAKIVFQSGTYVYFPASRAEIPHWLNRASLPAEDFDLQPRFEKLLKRPLYVERGLEPLKQWLLTVLLDARLDLDLLALIQQGREFGNADPNSLQFSLHRSTWDTVNKLLQNILGDDDANLNWSGRHRQRGGLTVRARGQVIVPSLDALSAGQAILLSMFGTLVRYADSITRSPAVSLSDIVGLCLIDEIDAHLHIELQHRVAPALMKLFPKVQFIVSTHSPLFVLGMEQSFGADGFCVIELPSGRVASAEAYAEFGKALEVFRETKAFSQAIADAVAQPGKMLVLVEGQTDELYYQTAINLLNREDLFDDIEIRWVGANNFKGGQERNTGATGLSRSYEVFRTNPEILARSVLILYDNDTKKSSSDEGKLFVRCVPNGSSNSRFKAGVESLLPDAVIGDDIFTEKVEVHNNGIEITRKIPDKMKLCRYVCEERKDPTDFQNFTPILDMIQDCIRLP